jgi:hypothetical protein
VGPVAYQRPYYVCAQSHHAPNRSGAEFARIVGHVLEQYPAASTIHLVMDNLQHTHP